MARITVEDCLMKVGNENRFRLIHLAVARVKQHRKGVPFTLKGKNKENVMTLREIASGDVNFENLTALEKTLKERSKAKEADEATSATD
ncbi:MAG: DNA-directed RNA polymerase subunit omega [Proteobacteria bacterium]|nr:DNA-directed RNA polymerase subunit omega [Pseudomonadota bacterium]MBU1688378.1 DNA-directed RNA polymerase subunit omega [Pseudomonadota bacterium]